MRAYQFGAIIRIAAAASCLLLSQRSTQAQGFEIVHSFTYGKGEPYGALLETSDGRIYGTSQSGGDFQAGSVFVLAPGGSGTYGFSEIHSFRGIDGSAPTGQLFLAANGTLYGACNSGGLYGLGTIFGIDSKGSFTSLHDFGGLDGSNPLGGLVAGADGALYGLTSSGGGIGYGSFYRIDLQGGFALLYSFGAPNGSLYPGGELVAAVDGFFGVAYAGGASSDGTVFKIDLSGSLTTLHEFSGTDGLNPTGGLVLSSGILYGTTSGGGDFSQGTVYSVNPATTSFQTLHSFGVGDGQEPLGRLFASGGFLYGTTFTGGAHTLGTVFRVDPANGGTLTLHDFAYGEGANPKAGVIQSSGGDFFGTTFNGTSFGWGTVFRVDTSGTFSTVHFFATTTGQYPQGLIASPSGDLIGVASGGGTFGWGLAYRVSPDGSFTDLHDFSILPDGGYPNSPLLAQSDGFFYGTASSGGANGIGTIFRLDASGAFANLHDFFDLTEGSTPVCGLTKASDGNFYGTTLLDGTGGQGIVFRMDGAFNVTRIHSLSGSEGSSPRGVLVEGPDTKLYGTTNGGTGGAFRVDTAGILEPLHTFDPATEGSAPPAGLLLGQDGYFYGTLSADALGYGSVFRMDSTGATTVVHTFAGNPDGAGPQGGLLEGAPGTLIGTTYGGGAHAWGTVFSLKTSGTIASLHDFSGLDGQGPKGDLVRNSAGEIYGVTELGGVGQYGVVFHISGMPISPSVTGIQPKSGRPAGGTSVRILGSHLPSDPMVSFGVAAAGAPIDLDAGNALVISPILSPGSLQDVSVTGTVEGVTSTLAKGWFADFLDVSQDNQFHDDIETLFRSGVTAGCGPGYFCPNDVVTRAQIAVLLLKSEHGPGYVPPSCVGVFADVACPGAFAVDWIERLAAEGITAGCGGGNYCPSGIVRRDQVAVFLLKASLGAAYVPPVVAQIFADVPPAAFAADWINDLYNRGIIGGCSSTPLLYCPASSSTRGQMAAFLVKTFNLQ